MLKNTIVVILLIAVLCAVQHYSVSHLAVFGVYPDIVTIYIALAAIRHGQKQGTSYGFIAGIATGLLSGNIGLEALTKTIEGFVAGYFHIPEDSHASSRQKRQMYYKGVFLASLFGRALHTLMANVLSLPVTLHVAFSIGVGTLLTMIVAVIAYQVFFKKIL
ncbi:MAG: rod shape-determining protein MreD [Chlorobiales bacterium]|nr:rod shape-determining protein MreD [Chlorobiales bacterium]